MRAGSWLEKSYWDSGESALERYTRFFWVAVWFVSLLTSWIYKLLGWTLGRNCLAPWELNCVLQPGHYEWTGIFALLFLRANNALSRGSNKDKLTDFFPCHKPIKYCPLHIWLIYLLFLLSTLMNIYSNSNCHIYSAMTQVFFVSLMPWGRCYWSVCQATVFDVQSCKVQGKVCFLAGFMESFILAAASCHTPCCSTSPDPSVMGIHWEITHPAIKTFISQKLNLYHILAGAVAL